MNFILTKEICNVLKYLSISPRHSIVCDDKKIMLDQQRGLVMFHRFGDTYVPVKQDMTLMELAYFIQAMQLTEKRQLQEVSIQILYCEAK